MTAIRRIFGIMLMSLLIYSPRLLAQGHELQQPPVFHYNKGVTLFSNRLFTPSRAELQEFIQKYPDHDLRKSAEYLVRRSQAHFDSLNQESYFESYILDYPYADFTSDLLITMAQKAGKNKNYALAEDNYQRAIELGLNDEKAPRVYYWKAQALASQKKYGKARADFLTLADQYPQSKWAPKALFARGRLFLTENKYDSSSVTFEKLKNNYPNNDVTRRIGTALGESYYQQHQYQKAIATLKKTMATLDGDAKSKAVLLIAESYNYLENFHDATTYYLEYINLNKGTPKVRNAHYGMGWVYNKQKIYHWAADEFEKAADGNDKVARKALYYKAVNEKLGSQYSKALKTFRNFGDRFQDGFWVEKADYEWAATAYQLGRYGESIEVLLPMVRKKEKLNWAGKIYTLLGRAYFASREYGRAVQAFNAAEKVADIDPAVKRKARFQKAWVMYNNRVFKRAQPVFYKLNQEHGDTEIGKEALFWSADAYYNMKDYGPASSQYKQFINKYPGQKLAGPAYYSLGWSYFKMGRYQKAIGPLKNFLTNYKPPEKALYPYDTDAKLRIGDSYYALKKYSDAIQFYQKAVDDSPGGDYAMFQIGNCYYRGNQNYKAVTTFRKFLKAHPTSRLRQQTQYNIAYIYLNSSNYGQAAKEFQTVIDKYPNTSWAARSQYNIGDAYYNSGKYKQAIAAYKKVMEKYPDSDYILDAANGIQYAQESSGKAHTDTASANPLEKFLADHPQTPKADRLRYRQAHSRLQSGNYKAAVDQFKQYIRITNDDDLLPEAHANLADAYKQMGNTEQAIKQYKVVVQKYADSDAASSALAALGNMLYKQGNYQQSLSYFQKLAKHKSDDYQLQAQVGMGNDQLAMGSASAAQKSYQAALTIQSDYAPAKVGQARVALKQNNYPKATSLLGPIAENNTDEAGAEAQYLTGLAYYQRGQYQEAVKEFSKVKVLYEIFNEWVAKSLLKKGQSYIQLGRNGDARSTLNSLVKSYPGTPQAREAKKLLNTQ